MQSLRKLTLIFAIAVLLPTFCWGWGRDGHRIIATVAEDHLNETTKVMIQSLIGNIACIRLHLGLMTSVESAGTLRLGIT